MDIEIVGRMLSTLRPDDDHPYRTGPWRPQITEWAADNLDVEGEIPADLDGVYLRNGENPVHDSIGRYHPFDGDGMIHLVGFRDGKAWYRNKFVRTDGLLAEQQAGESLWAGLAERPSKSLRPEGWGARKYLKDSSSTDIVVHNGMALSTHFECGDLYRLDPTTLMPRGKASWGGHFPTDRGISAHPKVDENTDEMLFFNYSARTPHMNYGVVDADDTLVHYVPIELPGARIPHDMAFTENYAILNDCPLFWDPALMEKGVYAASFHPEMTTRLGVIPRRGQSHEIRWFDAVPTYVLHWVNAYEDGNEIVLDGFFQNNPDPTVAPDATFYQRLGRWLSLDGMGTQLHRWRLNLANGECKEEQLSDGISEFGMINGQLGGRPYRYTYAAMGEPGRFLFNGLVKHDVVTGAEEKYPLPPGVFCSETAVAPRPDGTAEDDAYLVTLTIDVNNDRSECLVFDAARFSDGPVARIRLPERISSGTHATWAPGTAIPGWDRLDARELADSV